MTENAWIYQHVTDLADVRCEQVPMTRKDALMALVDNQVEIVDFHRIAVPMSPEEFDGFERQFSRFEITHEGTAENTLVPARIHALLDLVGESRSLSWRIFLAD